MSKIYWNSSHVAVALLNWLQQLHVRSGLVRITISPKTEKSIFWGGRGTFKTKQKSAYYLRSILCITLEYLAGGLLILVSDELLTWGSRFWFFKQCLYNCIQSVIFFEIILYNILIYFNKNFPARWNKTSRVIDSHC